MTDVETLKRYLQRALALAHAALDDLEPERVAEAQTIAHNVLSLLPKVRPATLADGHVLVGLANRLRTVLEALDGATAPTTLPLLHAHNARL